MFQRRSRLLTKMGVIKVPRVRLTHGFFPHQGRTDLCADSQSSIPHQGLFHSWWVGCAGGDSLQVSDITTQRTSLASIAFLENFYKILYIFYNLPVGDL